MPREIYDVIVMGAGSVGVPTAMFLAERKMNVLVLDAEHGPGQGNNKKAIGGIRATHSDYGKIKSSLRSIEILSTWRELYGDDIGWMANGYSYPAYNAEDEKKLKDLMKIQLSFGLNIRWVSPEEYNELVPGIEMEGLRGSTFSPEDGSCSPLLTSAAMYFRSLRLGANYRFNEQVIGFERDGDKVTGVVTNKGTYSCRYVINAAGNHAKDIGQLVHMSLPVSPDNHEAGITEPVENFFGPMVIDMRKEPGSANFYFYQNHEGQVVFCITPDPQIFGIMNESTSEFLPMCSTRMLKIYPRLRYLKVRRTWRGQYPMTPDGFPIVGFSKEVPNWLNVVGMCGQGFMLGAGIGELAARMIAGEETEEDKRVLESYDPYRAFTGQEVFK